MRLKKVFCTTKLIPLLGNHELKLLSTGQQGQPQDKAEVLVDRPTLSSYGEGGNPGTLASIPEAHWQFVQQHCVPWLETEGHIFVHATLDADKPLTGQPDTALFLISSKPPSLISPVKP
jgi:serine/threonine protein phosphatase 1